MHLRDTYGKLYEKLLGVRFQYIFVESKGMRWQMYRSPNESARLDDFVYRRLDDESYVKEVLAQTKENYDSFFKEAKELSEKNFAGASAKELAHELLSFCKALLKAVVGTSCSIIFASALGKKVEETASAEVVMKLAMPLEKTIPLQEEIEFWKLVQLLQEKNVTSVKKTQDLPKQISQAIQNHFDSFCWIEAYENDPIWKMENLIQRLN